MTYEAQRLEICQVGKLLYDRGYVVSNDERSLAPGWRRTGCW